MMRKSTKSKKNMETKTKKVCGVIVETPKERGPLPASYYLKKQKGAGNNRGIPG